jgi:hypothetical protein
MSTTSSHGGSSSGSGINQTLSGLRQLASMHNGTDSQKLQSLGTNSSLAAIAAVRANLNNTNVKLPLLTNQPSKPNQMTASSTSPILPSSLATMNREPLTQPSVSSISSNLSNLSSSLLKEPLRKHDTNTSVVNTTAITAIVAASQPMNDWIAAPSLFASFVFANISTTHCPLDESAIASLLTFPSLLTPSMTTQYNTGKSAKSNSHKGTKQATSTAREPFKFDSPSPDDVVLAAQSQRGRNQGDS